MEFEAGTLIESVFETRGIVVGPSPKSRLHSSSETLYSVHLVTDRCQGDCTDPWHIAEYWAHQMEAVSPLVQLAWEAAP